VLVYRALTYLLPIPLGAVCYLIWARYHRRQLHYAEESAPDQAVPS
jgi:hypothetical protein